MTTTTTDRQLVTVVLVVLAALLVLPVLFMGFGLFGFGPMMGGAWGPGMMTDGAVPGWLFVVGVVTQLLFVALLVGGAYLLYRAVTGSGESDRTLSELRLAYARGDLSDEEYERRLEVLDRRDS